jgi:hypothetical protein
MLRHKIEQELVIERPLNEVANAFHGAGTHVGAVKDDRRSMGTMVIRTVTKFLPPQNASTLRLTFEMLEERKTKVRIQSECFDGAIGFGSAGQAVDHLIAAADAYLSGRKPEKSGKNQMTLVATVLGIVAVLLVFIVWISI